MIGHDLVRVIREQFLLEWQGIHGAPHWARVRVILRVRWSALIARLRPVMRGSSHWPIVAV